MKASLIICMQDFKAEITLGTQYKVKQEKKKNLVHFIEPKEINYPKYYV